MTDELEGAMISERDDKIAYMDKEYAKMEAICQQQDKIIRDLMKENADLRWQLDDLDAGIGGFHAHN